MYNHYDYLQNGWTFLHNLLRPRHKTLTSLMIYSTTRCQSRCQHCSIWKKPAEHLSLDDIRRIMESKCVTARTTVGLEGGEFLLHPEADAILGWFDAHHPNYTLLSNALAPQKLTQMLEKHHPKHLYLSLDGDKSTYRHMRGVDGYEQVMQVIEQWHERIPISLMFCLSPWNSFRDMEHVIAVAKRYGIDVRLRCHSIFNELVIHSNGDVPICQNLDVVLGNIHERSLDEIFNSRESCETQCRHSHRCNECWINYHRKFDIILLRNLERLLPKRLIECWYGRYQWTTDRRMTYRQYMKQKTHLDA